MNYLSLHPVSAAQDWQLFVMLTDNAELSLIEYAGT
jgi:hypothetical protein